MTTANPLDTNSWTIPAANIVMPARVGHWDAMKRAQALNLELFEVRNNGETLSRWAPMVKKIRKARRAIRVVNMTFEEQCAVSGIR